MIRVLIVEDEPPIARAIAQITAAHPDFEVLGTEINGSDALLRLNAQPVDVVISDINMPVMDGVDLAAMIAKHHPGVITVFISGYQRFEYAQRAISHGVFDYLLKPLSKEKVNEMLDRLAAVWKARRGERRNRELALALEGVPMEPGGADNMLLVVSAGAYLSTDIDLSLGQAFWNGFDLFGALDACMSVKAACFITSAGYNGEKVVVLQYPDAVRGIAAAEGLYSRLCAATALPVTLAVHTAPVPMDGLHPLLHRMQGALRRTARLSGSGLLCQDFSAGEGEEPAAPSLDAAYASRIIEAVSLGESKALQVGLAAAIETLERHGGTQLELLRMLDTVVHDARVAERMDMNRYEGVRQDIREAIANGIGGPGLPGDLAEVLLAIGQAPAAQAPEAARRDIEAVVDEIEAYLQRNYRHSISNDMLAANFGYVPSYLSRVFRQYKGISPSEYLVRHRVDKAKQLMAESPAMLVREVAERVGYKDQYYFSKIFKKETGLWPKEYQSTI